MGGPGVAVRVGVGRREREGGRGGGRGGAGRGVGREGGWVGEREAGGRVGRGAGKGRGGGEGGGVMAAGGGGSEGWGSVLQRAGGRGREEGWGLGIDTYGFCVLNKTCVSCVPGCRRHTQSSRPVGCLVGGWLCQAMGCECAWLKQSTCLRGCGCAATCTLMLWKHHRPTTFHVRRNPEKASCELA